MDQKCGQFLGLQESRNRTRKSFLFGKDNEQPGEGRLRETIEGIFQCVRMDTNGSLRFLVDLGEHHIDLIDGVVSVKQQ